MSLIHFDKKSFAETLEKNGLMLVDFWATWCGPCRMLGPVIEELAEEYEGKAVTIGKVDVDEIPELAQQYGITGVPTVVFLENGKEFDRKVGAMPIQSYIDVLDRKLYLCVLWKFITATPAGATPYPTQPD